MQNRTELALRHEEWAAGVARSLKSSRYRPWADDIGREVGMILLEREAQGLPFPEWTGVLEGELRRLVDRIARRYHPRHHEAFEEEQYGGNEEKSSIRSAEDDENRESCRGPLLIALRIEFSNPGIEAMTRVCGARSRVTNVNLAEAVGLSVRTFKRTVKRLRDHRGEQ